jgi:hypothetical protein
MSELEWSSEGEAAPKKKRGIPAWVWIGCGGGCLLTVIVVAALAFFVKQGIEKGMDPDFVWGEIHEVLPHDERPTGYEPMFGFALFDAGQLTVMVDDPPMMMVVTRVGSSRELDQQFDPEARVNKGAFGVGAISGAEEGELELQGRSVRVLRFQAWTPDSGEEQVGTSIRVDVSGGAVGHAFVHLMSVAHDVDRITDEQVVEVFEPFDVWRGR